MRISKHIPFWYSCTLLPRKNSEVGVKRREGEREGSARKDEEVGLSGGGTEDTGSS